jgi:hypothetical protein
MGNGSSKILLVTGGEPSQQSRLQEARIPAMNIDLFIEFSY